MNMGMIMDMNMDINMGMGMGMGMGIGIGVGGVELSEGLVMVVLVFRGCIEAMAKYMYLPNGILLGELLDMHTERLEGGWWSERGRVGGGRNSERDRDRHRDRDRDRGRDSDLE